MRQAGDWITSYLLYTENTEPPELYRKWTAISVIASVLQRKCFLKWGRRTFYPNFYIVLIGPPAAARKSTAMGDGFEFLLQPGLNIHLAVDSTSRASLIRDLKDAQDNYTDSEGKIWLHSSLTVHSPELTVFLGYKDLQLLTDLIDWYDSTKNPWVHKTVQGGPQAIPGVWLNLMGATTPDLLRSSLPLEAVGGGLTSRMLFLYSNKMGKKVPDEFETREEMEIKEWLMHDLGGIALMGGQFKISQTCLSAYIDWYMAFNEQEECKDPRFAGYFGRKPTTLRKLLMIMCASRGNEKVISIEDFNKALGYLNEVEKTMYFALQGVGKNKFAEVMGKIMEELGRIKVCDYAYLMYKFRDDVTRFELDIVMKSLEAMRYCIVYENTGEIHYNEEFSESKEGHTKALRKAAQSRAKIENDLSEMGS